MSESMASLAHNEELIQNVIGLSVGELDRLGFDATVSVDPGPHYPCIIHIGQTHGNVLDAQKAAADQPRVIALQKKIEKVMLAAVKANNAEGVFDESVADEEVPPEIRSFIVNEARPDITRALAIPISSLESLKLLESMYKKYYKTALSNRMVYHFIGAQLAELDDRIRTERNAIISGTSIVVHVSDIEDLKVSQVIETTKVFAAVSDFGGHPNPYAQGGGWPAYIDGKIAHLYPATTTEAYTKAMHASKELSAAKEFLAESVQRAFQDLLEHAEDQSLLDDSKTIARLVGMSSSARTETEWQDLERSMSRVREFRRSVATQLETHPIVIEGKERWDAAQEHYLRATKQDREWALLECIHVVDEKKKTQGQVPEHAIVIFGSDHDFTNVVTAANESGTYVTRGLITVCPKIL